MNNVYTLLLAPRPAGTARFLAGLRMQNGLYYLAGSRNQLRFDPYQRLDWRINKSWTKDRYKMTL
jgi:hypothetical protein